MGKSDDEFWAAYEDPRWEARRQAVIAGAEFCCRHCGTSGYWCAACQRRTPGREACDGCGGPVDALQVHHRHYVPGRLPWEYTDAELCCLCVPCHEQATVLIRRGRRASERVAADPEATADDRATAEGIRTRLGWLEPPELVRAVSRIERLHSRPKPQPGEA